MGWDGQVPSWFEEDTRVDPENEEGLILHQGQSSVLETALGNARGGACWTNPRWSLNPGRSFPTAHPVHVCEENPPQLVEALHLIKENALSQHSTSSHHYFFPIVREARFSIWLSCGL
jgi:hypothetical protein